MASPAFDAFGLFQVNWKPIGDVPQDHVITRYRTFYCPQFHHYPALSKLRKSCVESACVEHWIVFLGQLYKLVPSKGPESKKQIIHLPSSFAQQAVFFDLI